MNILITGASSGLGSGMAKEFAKRGYSLALCARRIGELEKLKSSLLEDYPNIRVSIKTLDVNDHDQVFVVFNDFKSEFGSLERIIVNAGIGKGQPIGSGRFDANLATAQTNFIAALAQLEAAMAIFREQNSGHLVTISSVSAMKGLPGSQNVYAATKVALAHMSDGLRTELKNSPIKVSTIYPGYIRTEINRFAKKLPFEVDEATGCKAMVDAIEKEKEEALVPQWPWTVIGNALKYAPKSISEKLV